MWVLPCTGRAVGPPVPPGEEAELGHWFGMGVSMWALGSLGGGEAKYLGSFPASLLNHCDPGESSSTISFVAPL